jgi:sugar phosphate isomerase/epimerase
MLDLYHSWWDPEIWPLYAEHPADIEILQFSNVIEDDPAMKPGRDVPSNGVVDVGAHLRAAEAGGYKGWYEFELFDHHLAGRSVEAVVEMAVADYRAL